MEDRTLKFAIEGPDGGEETIHSMERVPEHKEGGGVLKIQLDSTFVS